MPLEIGGHQIGAVRAESVHSNQSGLLQGGRMVERAAGKLQATGNALADRFNKMAEQTTAAAESKFVDEAVQQNAFFIAENQERFIADPSTFSDEMKARLEETIESSKGNLRPGAQAVMTSRIMAQNTSNGFKFISKHAMNTRNAAFQTTSAAVKNLGDEGAAAAREAGPQGALQYLNDLDFMEAQLRDQNDPRGFNQIVFQNGETGVSRGLRRIREARVTILGASVARDASSAMAVAGNESDALAVIEGFSKMSKERLRETYGIDMTLSPADRVDVINRAKAQLQIDSAYKTAADREAQRENQPVVASAKARIASGEWTGEDVLALIEKNGDGFSLSQRQGLYGAINENLSKERTLQDDETFAKRIVPAIEGGASRGQIDKMLAGSTVYLKRLANNRLMNKESSDRAKAKDLEFRRDLIEEQGKPEKRHPGEMLKYAMSKNYNREQTSQLLDESAFGQIEKLTKMNEIQAESDLDAISTNATNSGNPLSVYQMNDWLQHRLGPNYNPAILVNAFRKSVVGDRKYQDNRAKIEAAGRAAKAGMLDSTFGKPGKDYLWEAGGVSQDQVNNLDQMSPEDRGRITLDLARVSAESGRVMHPGLGRYLNSVVSAENLNSDSLKNRLAAYRDLKKQGLNGNSLIGELSPEAEGLLAALDRTEVTGNDILVAAEQHKEAVAAKAAGLRTETLAKHLGYEDDTEMDKELGARLHKASQNWFENILDAMGGPLAWITGNPHEVPPEMLAEAKIIMKDKMKYQKDGDVTIDVAMQRLVRNGWATSNYGKGGKGKWSKMMPESKADLADVTGSHDYIKYQVADMVDGLKAAHPERFGHVPSGAQIVDGMGENVWLEPTPYFRANPQTKPSYLVRFTSSLDAGGTENVIRSLIYSPEKEKSIHAKDRMASAKRIRESAVRGGAMEAIEEKTGIRLTTQIAPEAWQEFQRGKDAKLQSWSEYFKGLSPTKIIELIRGVPNDPVDPAAPSPVTRIPQSFFGDVFDEPAPEPGSDGSQNSRRRPGPPRRNRNAP